MQARVFIFFLLLVPIGTALRSRKWKGTTRNGSTNQSTVVGPPVFRLQKIEPFQDAATKELMLEHLEILKGIDEENGNDKETQVNIQYVPDGTTTGFDAVSNVMSWVKKKERMVTLPEVSKMVRAHAENGERGAEYIPLFLEGSIVDAGALNHMVDNIHEDGYSLKAFWEDCQKSFPELGLYMVGSEAIGRTAEEEYQRTVGALFAVYWFMRWDLDGKNSFCYGVDLTSWAPILPPSNSTSTNPFLLNDFSSELQVLLKEAQLLGADGKVNKDQTKAMFVLTAIHDIMKMKRLWPTVGRGLEFQGFTENEQISDHDAALGYFLDQAPEPYPELPSYSLLGPAQKEVVKSTQVKHFNFGWFVQAETPPSKFQILNTDTDLSFQFVHFLTDLGGGAGTPLGGCEQLVVGRLATLVPIWFQQYAMLKERMKAAEKSENTAITAYEEYLKDKWKKLSGKNWTDEEVISQLGNADVARMRLVVMAETFLIDNAFNELTHLEQTALRNELALTGYPDGSYSSMTLKSEYAGKGPAFVLYYFPAVLKNHPELGSMAPENKDELYVAALQILAHVHAQARKEDCFPLLSERAGITVTLQFGALKTFFEKKSLKEITTLAASRNDRISVSSSSGASADVLIKPDE